MDARRQSRQEKILTFVKDFTAEKLKHAPRLMAGVSAGEAAEVTQLNRANVSKELNLLHQSGQLIKCLGKPTRFLHRRLLTQAYPEQYLPTTIPCGEKLCDYLSAAGKQENPPGPVVLSELERTIGASGSLRTAVEQAKAAVTYPPCGLHTLITGSTGVGKIRFARLMYEYGIGIGRLKKDSPFITFNCQDYFGSPHLLIAQLFGNSKGAIPGADKNRKGLVEQAAGGVLYFDGIHKLPPKVQEQLVTLMEKNTFSRLGEASVTRYGDFMMIAASTLPPSAPELQRFTRSMPVSIRLPDLSERGPFEILQHLALFFSREASATGMSIRIHKDLLAFLTQVSYPGQIGEMKSRIKIICSHAYLEYSSFGSDSKTMEIAYRHLPSSATQSPGRVPLSDIEVQRLFSRLAQDYVLFIPGEAPEILLNSDKEPDKIDAFVPDQPVSDDIDHYISRCVSRLQSGGMHNWEQIRSAIPAVLYEAVQQSLSGHEEFRALVQNASLLYGLLLHLHHAVQRCSDDCADEDTNGENLERLNPREYAAADEIRRHIAAWMGVTLSGREMKFLVTYLYLAMKWSSSSRIAAIVVCHGRGIAEKIAEYLNCTTGCDIAVGISFDTYSSMPEFLERLTALAKERAQDAGILLMADMAPLTALHQHITAVTGIRASTVSGLALPQMAELAGKIRQGGYSLTTLLCDDCSAPARVEERSAGHGGSDFLNRIINEILATSLTFLNPRKAADTLLGALDRILEDFRLEYTDEIALKFIFHCSHMLERVIRNEPLRYPHSKVFINQNSRIAKIVEQRMSYVGEVFGITIPAGELCYTSEIFLPFLQ